MELSKAIEILTDHTLWCDPIKECDTFDALRLGIEALKYHLERRHEVDAVGSPLLPGETED